MAKQCPRCGYINPDNANYCLNCGYPLPPPIQPTPLPPPAPYNPPQDRITRAFNIFTKNLSIIVPSIILLIVEIILAVILGAITFFAFLASPFASLALAIVLAIINGIIDAILFGITVHTTMYMAQDSVNNLPLNMSNSFSNARSTLSQLYTIIGILILFGILAALSRSVIIAWFILGLVGIILYIVSASVVLNKPMSVTSAIDWYGKSLSKDAGSTLVLLLGALFSLIPIINIFAIPYTSILTYLMVKEIS